MTARPWVLIIMGSDSDAETMSQAAAALDEAGVPYTMTVASAHRSPERTKQIINDSERDGCQVFIAGAGMAAHLPGVVASLTTKPVIGVPLSGSALQGVDALYAVVQMPPGIPVATFGNAAGGIRDLPIQPWAADLVKKRMADNSKDNPDAHCLPMGFLQFHTHPEPRKIVQTPDTMVIIYEANEGLRQIHLDGRPLPGPEAEPWWYGYSVGKWEGDTLVVETTNFHPKGNPMGGYNVLSDENLRLVERFRRTADDTVEYAFTVDNPTMWTKPWTATINWKRSRGELLEYACHEGNYSLRGMLSAARAEEASAKR